MLNESRDRERQKREKNERNIKICQKKLDRQKTQILRQTDIQKDKKGGKNERQKSQNQIEENKTEKNVKKQETRKYQMVLKQNISVFPCIKRRK